MQWTLSYFRRRSLSPSSSLLHHHPPPFFSTNPHPNNPSDALSIPFTTTNDISPPPPPNHLNPSFSTSLLHWRCLQPPQCAEPRETPWGCCSSSSIDDFVADAIITQLLLLDAQDSTKDIRLFINSTGGSLSATMAIYDVVRLVRADISTIALAIAASTASIILGGGTKGKRFAMPNTRIMVHQPLGGASGQAIDVEIQAREVMHNKTNVTKIISDFTGRSFEQVEKDIDRDCYMSPMEAVEYGIIDGVIDGDTIIPLEPVPERVKASNFNYEEISKDPKKFLTPEIPNDEIY